MRQIAGIASGVPFVLTIPLNEIKTRKDIPVLEASNTRILYWATQRFSDRKTTIKTSNHWLTSEFNDGRMQEVLRIEGCMYGGKNGRDIPSSEVETAVKDLEKFIKTTEIHIS